MTIFTRLAGSCTIVLMALSGCSRQAACEDPGGKHAGKVDSLLSVMTLDEKVGQLTLFTSDWATTGPSIRPDYLDNIREGRCGNIFNAYTAAYTRQLQEIAVRESRLGIPLLFGYDVIHGFRTIFPINLAASCSWDLAAIEQSAKIAAAEASAAGLHWTFAPMCDISVDPRWGRISEGAGEDPYLGAQIAAAMTRGFQGDCLADTATVMACVKHFAAYGAPQGGRDYNTVDMSERWLREFYLPPYKAAVDAGAMSVMTSFNEFDGVPATGNHRLLTEILRDEWGFKGLTVSDYTSVNEMILHGFAADSADAARLAIHAGLDMDMQSAAYFAFLKELVETGKVSRKALDQAVRRVLTAKAALGLFDDPFRYCSEERESRETMTRASLDFARALAAESMVLLKNDGVLPLKRGEKIALIGGLADSADDLLGSWRGAGQVDRTRSICEVLREMAGDGNLVYSKGCDEFSQDRSGFADALSAASCASKVVLVLGEDCQWTGEAASRTSISLPGVQTELLEKIVATGKPVVVVLLNGRPLDLSRESVLADAMLEAWYPGTMGAGAVADILYGTVNPSGRLTVTFPRNLGQVPLYYYAKNTGRPFLHPEAKYESRYLDSPNTPLYPFGFGLSYTEYEYSPLELSDSVLTEGGKITASLTVTNTGTRAGIETVQLYIQDCVGSVTRPVMQLKGFERISLQPQESGKVSFEITPDILAFYRQDMCFGTEPGAFRVMVGPASDRTRGKNFMLK